MTKTIVTLQDCHDCGAEPGQPHRPGCDTERCSVCGGQRIQCRCKGHDRAFARWTGIWPGAAESASLGINLNEFLRRGLHRVFFVKHAVKRTKTEYNGQKRLIERPAGGGASQNE